MGVVCMLANTSIKHKSTKEKWHLQSCCSTFNNNEKCFSSRTLARWTLLEFEELQLELNEWLFCCTFLCWGLFFPSKYNGLQHETTCPVLEVNKQDCKWRKIQTRLWNQRWLLATHGVCVCVCVFLSSASQVRNTTECIKRKLWLSVWFYL